MAAAHVKSLGGSEYKAGMITKVSMKNFLTYADVSFSVGPRLNVVLGPNGSGKSSIVCALALGLGGEPKVLGRSKTLGDFVMRGQMEASVEVTILDKGLKPIKLFRTFKAGSNSRTSTWKMNGRPTTHNAVKTLTADLGIQVGNLCTFLPQDKVGDFSGFSSEELLLETQKAISTSSLHAEHEKLKEMQKTVGESAEQVTAIGAKLKNEKELMQRMEADVTAMREREKNKEDLKLLEIRKGWLDVHAKVEKAREAWAVCGQTERAEAAAQQEHQPLVVLVADWKKEVDAKRGGREKAKAAEAAHGQNLAYLEEAVDNAKGLGERAVSNLANAATRLKKKEDKVTDLKATVQEQKAEIALRGNDEAIQQALKRLEVPLKEAQEECALFSDERDEKQAKLRDIQTTIKGEEARLLNLKNLTNRKARALAEKIRNGNHAMSVLAWLDGNRGLFEKHVHGPIALEVSVSNKELCAPIEAHIPQNRWTTFVTECMADHDKLVEELSKMKINMDVVNIEGGGVCRGDKRRYTTQQMASFQQSGGVHGLIDDFLVCSDTVRQALWDHTGVQNVLLGSAATKDAMARDESFANIITGQRGSTIYLPMADGRGGRGGRQGNGVQWECSKSVPSRYSRDISARNYEVSGNDLLSHASADEAAIKVQEDKLVELNEALSGLESEVMELEGKVTQAEAKKKNVNNERRAKLAELDDVKRLRMKVSAAMGKLKAAEKALTAEKEGALQSRLTQDLSKAVVDTSNTIRSMQETQEKLIRAQLKTLGANMSFSYAKSAYDRSVDKLRVAETEQKGLRDATADAKRRYQELRKEAKEANKKVSQHKLYFDKQQNEPTPLKLLLDELPDKVECVEVRIENLQQLLDSVEHNPEAIRQYEEREVLVKDLEKQLEGLSSNKKALDKEKTDLSLKWVQGLLPIVDKLNKSFTEYMSDMGCEGCSVRLKPVGEGDHPPTGAEELDDYPRRFEEWGMEILVRFRADADLSVLSQHVHSGGERSVSTILFLMALQDLQHSPFRVVDEINQGMDPKNERLVFSRIVENSCGPDKPQYFLITPKLLQGLVAMEKKDVTILTVFNGPWSVDSSQAFETMQVIKRKLDAAAGGGGDSSSSKRAKAT